jgi:hypothetical protein
MPDWGWLLAGLAATGLFFVPAVWLWGRQRQKRAGIQSFLRSEPLIVTPPIVPGRVLAQGTCTTEHPLHAPLSEEPCVGYVLRVSVLVDDTDGGTYWDLAYVDRLAPFRITLGDRRVPVAVEPSFLWLHGPATTRRNGCLKDLSVDLHNSVLRQARKRWAGTRPDAVPRPGQTVRLSETLLRSEATVLVVGEATATTSTEDASIKPRDACPLLALEGTRDDLLKRLSGDLFDPHLLRTLEELMPSDGTR